MAEGEDKKSNDAPSSSEPPAVPPPRWPPHFPAECPASMDAKPAEGVVFRFCTKKPVGEAPHPKDCKSNAERNSAKSFGPDQCKACGLSVVRDEASVREAREVIPGFRRLPLAVAELNASHGDLAPTPSTRQKGHWTWWVANGVDPTTLLRVLNEGTKP
jgi:hypothetical protein